MTSSTAHRQLGQSLIEYTLICAALCIALLVPVIDGVSPDQPRSALDLLLDGFREAYEKFSYSISLPG